MAVLYRPTPGPELSTLVDSGFWHRAFAQPDPAPGRFHILGDLQVLAMVPTRVSPDPTPIVPLHCNSILADQDCIRKYLGVTQLAG